MKKKLISILPSIISILIGLIAGWYLLFVTNPADSFYGLYIILCGGFIDGISGLGTLLYAATPIILTGLSVGFSIKTDLFNIGASGQFTIGAFVAILVGVKATFLPPVIHCIVAIIAGTLAGGIWGVIVGFLKAYFKVNEVISGILLNYIAMLLTNLLIKNYVYDSMYNRTLDVAKSALIPKNLFDSILPGSKISISFFIALAVVILMKVLIDRSCTGYEFKITGKNKYAGRYAGMIYSKNVIKSMLIAGMLAGLGGALMYLTDFGDHISVVDVILQQGFTGISVALLGMSDPIGTLIASLFIAQLTIGGNYLQLFCYSPEVVDIMIAIIVYCGALVYPIRIIIDNIISKRKKKTEIKEEA